MRYLVASNIASNMQQRPWSETSSRQNERAFDKKLDGVVHLTRGERLPLQTQISEQAPSLLAWESNM